MLPLVGRDTHIHTLTRIGATPSLRSLAAYLGVFKAVYIYMHACSAVEAQ